MTILSPLHESRVVLRGGIRWYVQIARSAVRSGSARHPHSPAVLLLHGTGSSSDSFRELLPLLVEEFATVIAPDLPGHARTETPPTFVPSLPIMAAAVEELLIDLDVAPAVLVGHSAGAAIIAQLALQGGESVTKQIDLLVGLAAALAPFQTRAARILLRPMAKALAKMADVTPTHSVLFRSLRKRETVARMIRSMGSSLEDEGIDHYHRLASEVRHVQGTLSMMARWELESLLHDLPSLETPFLLLAGDRDRAVPVVSQLAVAKRMGSGATVKVVENTGHLLHEEKPALVARLIVEAHERHHRAGAPDRTKN